MAESRVIDAYLTELRYSIDALEDADDIVDEAADHLYSAFERLVESGTAVAHAEQQVLARFGSATLVAKVFAEEAKRGAAVSTTLTRRAGIAAMTSVALLSVGEAGNEIIARGALHGVAVGLILAGVAGFAVGLWGIRRRHGGLGRVGRVAFWWFVVSPVLAAPGGWVAHYILAAEWLLIMSLLGVGMIRARVLPIPAVVLFTMSPLATIVIVLGMSVAGINLGNWFLAFLAPVAVGYAWLGRAMWREPALDLRPSERGPMAVA